MCKCMFFICRSVRPFSFKIFKAHLGQRKRQKNINKTQHPHSLMTFHWAPTLYRTVSLEECAARAEALDHAADAARPHGEAPVLHRSQRNGTRNGAPTGAQPNTCRRTVPRTAKQVDLLCPTGRSPFRACLRRFVAPRSADLVASCCLDLRHEAPWTSQTRASGDRRPSVLSVARG